MSEKTEIVYTPENEPYLGRESVMAFDKMILACLSVNEVAAPRSFHPDCTELQKAAAQIIPQGISIACSIRELVRQGYLLSAIVLIRPLIERSATIRYLIDKPNALKLWTDGWKYHKRPKLPEILNYLGKEDFPDIGRELIKPYNSLIHGDPDSATWNLRELSDGAFGHPVTKNLNNPSLCDKICFESSTWISVLTTSMLELFPDASDAG